MIEMSEIKKYPEAPIDNILRCPKCGSNKIQHNQGSHIHKILAFMICKKCGFKRVLWQYIPNLEDPNVPSPCEIDIAKRLQEADWFEWQYWNQYNALDNQKILNQKTMIEHQKKQISKLQSELAHKTELVNEITNKQRFKSW